MPDNQLRDMKCTVPPDIDCGRSSNISFLIHMQESNDIKRVKMTKILHFTRLSDLAAFFFTLYYAANIIVQMIMHDDNIYLWFC